MIEINCHEYSKNFVLSNDIPVRLQEKVRLVEYRLDLNAKWNFRRWSELQQKFLQISFNRRNNHVTRANRPQQKLSEVSYFSIAATIALLKASKQLSPQLLKISRLFSIIAIIVPPKASKPISRTLSMIITE